MNSLPPKTRRELLGVWLGATIAGSFGIALALVGAHVSEFILLIVTVLGAVVVGRWFRGEWGWMASGSMFGVVFAHLVWSNPKFNHSLAGLVPGALIGLVLGVIRDLMVESKGCADDLKNQNDRSQDEIVESDPEKIA